MPDTYADFQREPSKSHQCMHFSEKDGTRCGAMSMHNEYMCYAHRSDEILTVVQNDMFLIENVATHAAIQKAFGDVAARLACNHIDLKRAELLIPLLRAASRNLREAAAARRQALREAAIAQTATESGAPHLDSERWVPPNPADLLQNCHPERSSASAPNAVEGPAVASHTATTPRTSPKAPKRIYTDEEKDFLKCTTSSTHYAPVHRPRPESITDDDIIAAINALRRRCSLGPIDTDPNWNKATLSTDPVHPPASRYPEASASALASRYPEASASGLAPAAQEEAALAPGVSNSVTLPAVHAVAAPTYHLPLATYHSHYSQTSGGLADRCHLRAITPDRSFSPAQGKSDTVI